MTTRKVIRMRTEKASTSQHGGRTARTSDPVDEAPTLTVLICRGCCCGTVKHEDVDHDAQVERLRDATATVPGALVRITDCLGPCERSNVIVVRHRDLHRPGMRTGTTWLGGVLGPETTNALAVWVTNGAGRLAVPRVLEPMVFDPTEVSVTPDHEITFLDTTADATERS